MEILWLHLFNKRVRPTKNEPQQGISYLEREMEGVRERGRSARERKGVGERESGGPAGRHI
jgi:hypothetical protein